MTAEPLSPQAARRVFLSLTLTRWFPVGLVIGLFTLLPLERGLTVAQTLTASALAGFVVFALELPTSGFADAFGRRPVFITAAVVNVLAAVAYLVAQSFWMFALAACLMGVFRALDSGPLEAWYVDTVHASDRGADVDGALAAQGTLLGGGIATGALISGGLVWWHPFEDQSALVLPVVVFVVLNVMHLVAVLVLLKEPRTHVDATGARRAVQSVKEAPGWCATAWVSCAATACSWAWWSSRSSGRSPWSCSRPSSRSGSPRCSAARTGRSADGSGRLRRLGRLRPRRCPGRAVVQAFGVTRTAILARVLNSLGAVVMGLVAGPAALIAAYLLTYGLHGSNGPMHSALLHREAEARNRATVLSMNSMMAFAAFSIASPLLGVLAENTSNQVAMVSAGAFSILGRPLLPARPAPRAVDARPWRPRQSSLRPDQFRLM